MVVACRFDWAVNDFFILESLSKKSMCSRSFDGEPWTQFFILFENVAVACSFDRGGQCLFYFGNCFEKINL